MTQQRGIAELSVGEYLDQLAAASSVPGGGSAAALAGAMGAALLTMVTRLSLKKSVAGPGHKALQDAAPEVERLVQQLADLSQEDVNAYRAVIATRKESADTPRRDERLAEAFEGAARIPLQTATLARNGLDLAERVAPFAWDAVSSDLETARHLLVTAFEGGMANVSINLADLSGEARSRIAGAYEALMARRPDPVSRR